MKKYAILFVIIMIAGACSAARSFASQGDEGVDFSGTAPSLYNQTNATFVCWFKAGTAPTSGANMTLFNQERVFNENVRVNMLTGGDADDGSIQIVWRTPTALALYTSTNNWDNDVWHRLVIVRNSSSPYVVTYIDGANEGSSVTDPTTIDTDPVDEVWGRQTALANSSFGGELARCAFFTSSLTVEQADSFLYTGRCGVQPSHWIEMAGYSPEPDWSGGDNEGTVTGTSTADHPPLGPSFGFSRLLPRLNRVFIKFLAMIGLR